MLIYVPQGILRAEVVDMGVTAVCDCLAARSSVIAIWESVVLCDLL